MARNPHEATAQAGGKQGYSGGTHGAYGGGDGKGGGDAPHLKTQTTFTPKNKATTGDGKKSILDFSPTVQLATMAYKGIKRIFAPTAEQKRASYTKKGLDIHNPAEMHGYQTKYGRPRDDGSGQGGDGMAYVTTATQSLVTAPTADKGAGFGHQWNFQAYGNQTQTAANPYDYTKAPYAKKGKLIRKYATGQEIKNFSKGKRFGPPPLKGPDPQGLQVILENSDYFKKLIG